MRTSQFIINIFISLSTRTMWRQSVIAGLGLTLMVCAIAGDARSATEVGGTIDVDTTWTLDKSPYIVTGDVFVLGNEARLTIEPGVEVRFEPGTGLQIGRYTSSGTLVAQGSESSPITFTSNAATPASGDWKGIYFDDDTTDENTILEHCIVEYGGAEHNANVFINESLPTIANCTIRKSGATGIYIDESSPTISNCTIQENNEAGIYLYRSSAVIGREGDGNLISNNRTYGIYGEGSGTPTVSNNTISNNGAAGVGISANTELINNDFSGNGFQGIEITGGDITRAITWRLKNSPCIVAGDIIVEGGTGWLTIEPGTEVRFEPGTGLQIGGTNLSYGALSAQGTESLPITFTSNAVSPSAGGWEGIYFNYTTVDENTILDYCIVEYGGNKNDANIYIRDASPTIKNCTIQNSSGYAIAGCWPNLKNNTYTNNAKEGIAVIECTLRSGDHTFELEDSPYIVIGDFSQIGTGNPVLSIDPGVELRFGPEAEMYIGKGALIAQGTELTPILFTSNAANPAPGDWKGIRFGSQMNDAETIMQHCIVEYGGFDTGANVYLYNADPDIRYNTFRYSSDAGIKVSGSSTIIKNSFEDNLHGIAVASGSPEFHLNQFVRNEEFGVYNPTGNVIDATNNWWSDPNGPNRNGDWVSNDVTFFPWMTAPRAWRYETPVTSLLVKEPGGSTIFSFQLTDKPTADVVIPVFSFNTGQVYVSPTVITLNEDNWDAGEKIHVAAMDESLADGDRDIELIIGPAVSEDERYDGTSPYEKVFVTVEDDDVAEFALTAIDPKVGQVGETLTATLEGYDLDTDTRVFIQRKNAGGNPVGEEIEIAPVTFIDAKTLSVNLNVEEPGQYAVRIDNGEAEHVLNGAISFTEPGGDPLAGQKAIIVAASGPYEGNALWKATRKNADKAYHALFFQGYADDAIQYLSAEPFSDATGDGTNDVDADATASTLYAALTEWAADAEEVILYITGHGGEGNVVLNAMDDPPEILSAAELDGWLDALQSPLSPLKKRLIFVYDACMSGSVLSQLADDNRILLTGASSSQRAWFVDEGEVSFSYNFWDEVFLSGKLYGAFRRANDMVGAVQNPRIDWNGDGVPDAVPSDIAEVVIGRGAIAASVIPTIGGVFADMTLGCETSATLWAKDITTANAVKSIWARIIPPAYDAVAASEPVTVLPTLKLRDLDGDGKYEEVYEDLRESGAYRVSVYAEDKSDYRSLPTTRQIVRTCGIRANDISGNGVNGIEDAVIALKLAAGMDVSDSIVENHDMLAGDINDDVRIGVADAIGVMWSIANE